VIIISLPPTNQDADRLLHAKIPFTLVDAWHPDLGGIHVDDLEGGYMATHHMLELGHHKIAFISDYLETPFNYTSMKRRFTGFIQALEEFGVPFEPDYHVQGDHGRAEAKQMAKTLLHLPERPTAIFAASDAQAIGVLDAARELGIRVPDDLSVIGYDDIRDAEYNNLTTIQQPLFESGKLGAEFLLDRIENPVVDNEPTEILLDLALVERGTTAPPPARN